MQNDIRADAGMRDVPGCLVYFFLISFSLIVSSLMKIPCERGQLPFPRKSGRS